MSLDAVTVKALCEELKPSLEGCRADKINQPGPNLFVFGFHGYSGSGNMLVSLETGSARVQLTERKYANTDTPPMFCMLLRKHILGGRLTEITQCENDRILKLVFEKASDFSGLSSTVLIIELIGKYSNMILCGADGIIIDAARRHSIAGTNSRPVLPGLKYEYPSFQEKASVFNLSVFPEEKYEDGEFSEKWLINTFSGISPIVSREVFHRFSGTREGKPAAVEFVGDIVRNGSWEPTMVLKNGEAVDYTFFRPQQYGTGAELKSFPSFSALFDEYYFIREHKLLLQRRSKDLFQTVNSAKKKLQKKLAAQETDLIATEERDDIRHKAELISANIYRLRKGDRQLVCCDFCDADNAEISIELDPLKSPQENAALLFKKYKKMKTANSYLTKLIAENKEQLEYLDSVLYELNAADSDEDFSAIRKELIMSGILKEKKGSKKEKQKKTEPFKYVSPSGFEILAGRSNLQNEELTFKTAMKYDLWFHVKNYHGSHVILRTNGLEPAAEDIVMAAAAAVLHSEASASVRAAVDYTAVKNVKKPSGSKPGFVNFFDYSTVIGDTSDIRG